MSLNKPATREEFKEFCLRQLGKPVISVDVTDDQVEDCVEMALSYYTDYHYDGSEPTYLKHQITQETKDAMGFEIPNDIIGIRRIFQLGGNDTTSTNMFSFQYQFTLDMIQNLSDFSMVDYYTTRLRYAQITEMLTGHFPIRYNRHKNFLHLDCNPAKLVPGNYVLVECYTAINPNTDTDVWSDRWLIKYTTALIKKQWGQNVSKFEGVMLPGGVTLNGSKIYDDAVGDIQQLEDDMISTYSIPPLDLIM